MKRSWIKKKPYVWKRKPFKKHQSWLSWKRTARAETPWDKAYKQAWRACSRYIRLRDQGQCFTCPNKSYFKRTHAGHFLHARHATFFNPLNIHAQCVECNIYRSGNYKVYRRRMIEKYGLVEVKTLERLSRTYKKWTEKELIEIAANFKRLTSQLFEGVRTHQANPVLPRR